MPSAKCQETRATASRRSGPNGDQMKKVSEQSRRVAGGRQEDSLLGSSWANKKEAARERRRGCCGAQCAVQRAASDSRAPVARTAESLRPKICRLLLCDSAALLLQWAQCSNGPTSQTVSHNARPPAHFGAPSGVSLSLSLFSVGATADTRNSANSVTRPPRRRRLGRIQFGICN